MTDLASSVRSGYDRWATVYDHDANPLLALEEPVVRAEVGDVRGKSVLDLGCGTGRHTIWLAEAGAMVTAVDFSEGMMAQARRKRRAERVHFITHDLHKPLPFAADTFDLVVNCLVLEHLQDLTRFFADVHRVLKPGGRAVVSTMHPAMFLRDSQARFTDPESKQVIEPGSIDHPIGAFVMAAVRAGLQLSNIVELAPDSEFAAKYPRAEKYIGWPMLIVLALKRSV